MNSWKHYNLIDVADVKLSNVDKKTKPNERTVHLCNYTDVYKNHFINKDLTNNFMIATCSENDYKKFNLKEGQVAITKDSEKADDIGVSTFISENLPNVVLGYHLSLITPNKDQLDGRFLHFWFNTKHAKRYFENNASGSGQRYSLNFDIIKSVPLILPILSEQQQIAKVLSDLDAKIEVNNQINRELEAMAKLVYDYWFVQFDFPVASSISSASMSSATGREGTEVLEVPYKSSGGKMVYNEALKREIPEGWDSDKIGNLLSKDIKTIKIPSSDYLEKGKIPIIDQSSKFICGYTDNIESKIKINEPRIIFGDHTRIIKLINFDFARGADGTQVLLSNNKRVPQYYFYHSITKIDLSNYGYARHFKFLKDISVVVPNIEMTIKFEKKVSQYYELIKSKVFENQQLGSLRDWLLPMLMNGQVNVGKAYKEGSEEMGLAAEGGEGYVIPRYPEIEENHFVKRKMMASYIINQSLEDTSFGDVKFEKLLYLADYHAIQRNLGQKYKQNAAGPFDNTFTYAFFQQVLKAKWFTKEKLGSLNRIKAGENQSKSVNTYGYFSEAELNRINEIIGYFKDTNYEKPEIVATLYAVWNNRIIKKQPVTDELLKQDFLNWEQQKIKYKNRLDTELEWMREVKLIPNGWGEVIERKSK